MMGSIIREYIRAFRWQNVKNQYKFGAGYLSMNILFIAPNASVHFGGINAALVNFLINLPIAFALFTTTLQSMALSKMMYLCPMSKDMRREYIRKSCLVRMIAPVLVGFPGIAWLLASGMFDWLCGIGILLNVILFSVLFGRGSNSLNYARWKAERNPSSGLDDVFGVRQLLSIVITIIINFIYAALIGEGDSWWVQLILIGVSLLTLLPITISCMKEWPEAIEQAVTYEGSGGIWREQESK